MLTVAALLAMWLPPLRDQSGERPRIALDAQFAMLSVVVAYVLAMAMVGGAELARYMLPVVPLVILVCVSTLWRRVRLWLGVVAIVAADVRGGMVHQSALRVRSGRQSGLSWITSVCTSVPKNSWRRAIPWRGCLPPGRPATN